MSDKLKIISLGGLNEVGKNITVLEYKDDIIVIDCGIGFPDGDVRYRRCYPQCGLSR
jgi:ribonuclease J